MLVRLSVYSRLTMPIATNVSGQEIELAAEEPNYDGIVFHSIERVFDLRRWVSVSPSNANSLIELCVLTTRYWLERPAYRGGIQFPFKTSGADVFPFVMAPFDHNARSTFADLPTGSSLRKLRRLWVDLNQAPVNTPFEICVGATFWNAFQKTNQWWAGFQAFGETDQGSLLVIFPEDKPVQGYKFTAIP